MQTSPCNEYPLTPHFYIVKLGFTGVCIIFLFLLYHNFSPKTIIFSAVKYCSILHGHVCVMRICLFLRTEPYVSIPAKLNHASQRQYMSMLIYDC